LHKILPFQCQKQLIFHKVGLSFLDFFIIFYCTYVGSGSEYGNEMQSGPGSAEAKSCGSCGSGSGSTTLIFKVRTIIDIALVVPVGRHSPVNVELILVIEEVKEGDMLAASEDWLG
jgi:hypothetical protein